jgi:hypothetical protein
MHPRISELLDYLDGQRDALCVTASNVREEHRTAPPPGGGWSVLEILDHLRITEGRIAMLISKLVTEAKAASLPPETERAPLLATMQLERVLDRGTRIKAPNALTPQAAADLDTALRALDETRAKLKDAVVAADGLALGQIKYPHLVFGDLTLYEWIAFVGAHEARHADQIREVGASLGAPS